MDGSDMGITIKEAIFESQSPPVFTMIGYTYALV
jgi:hypothetical protein